MGEMSIAAARRIVAAVALERDVCVRDIFSDCRLRHVAYARQEAFRRLHDAGWAMYRIGKFIGRHHTTVRYALMKGETCA